MAKKMVQKNIRICDFCGKEAIRDCSLCKRDICIDCLKTIQEFPDEDTYFGGLIMDSIAESPLNIAAMFAFSDLEVCSNCYNSGLAEGLAEITSKMNRISDMFESQLKRGAKKIAAEYATLISGFYKNTKTKTSRKAANHGSAKKAKKNNS